MKRTRFAPSPTGLLHLGNAFSALSCEQWAKQNNAKLLLRMEDIDFTRCSQHFAQQILRDLSWLKLSFDDQICYQQQRLDLYQEALDKLIEMQVLYPCFCTRKQVAQVLSQHKGETNISCLDSYPKTCQNLSMSQRMTQMQHTAYAWRLDMASVRERLGNDFSWSNTQGKSHTFSLAEVGDVIIGRKDIRFSYHLSVVVDDEYQHISHVIRGDDLRKSTMVHVLLQQLLGYHSIQYCHHQLITDVQGIRLAKSKRSPTLKALQSSGVTADTVRKNLDF